MKPSLYSRYFILPFTTILLLFLSTAYANTPDIKFKTNGVLNVISYSEFRPISYGTGQGYEGDLLRAIAKLWHVKIKFYPEAIYEGIWVLPSRAYTIADVAMGGFTPADYRIKEGATFSIMTTRFDQSLLIRKRDYESQRIVSYQSFKNSTMKIGVVHGTTGEQYAQARAKNANIDQNILVEFASESDLLPALKNGTIDAIARGEIGNEYQASMNKNLMTIAKKDFHEGFSFAIDKTNVTLINQLNLAIRQVTDNGKITYLRWLNNHHVFTEQVDKLLRNVQKNRQVTSG